LSKKIIKGHSGDTLLNLIQNYPLRGVCQSLKQMKPFGLHNSLCDTPHAGVVLD
jgi:hypothetical protein